MQKFYFSFVFYFIFLSSLSAQTTITLDAFKDNTIYSESGSISNGTGQYIFSGSTLNLAKRRALMKFDIAAQIPAGASISSVNFTLFSNQPNSNIVNRDINIHPLLADWGESNSNAPIEEGQGAAAEPNDATWTSRFHPSSFWTAPGGDFAPIASATTPVGAANTSYNWSSAQLTADVQNWLDNPASNFGWVLIGNESIATTAKRFASREHPVTTQRPKLTITYTVSLVYTFSGNGNWSDSGNWLNNTIPPSTLPAGSEIIIDPLPTGECVLDTTQRILPGGKITVQPNKKLIINGELGVQ